MPFSYSSSKWAIKQQSHSQHHNAIGPGTANEHSAVKFCKGDQSLEDEEHNGWPLDVDNNQLKVITEAVPLTTK